MYINEGKSGGGGGSRIRYQALWFNGLKLKVSPAVATSTHVPIYTRLWLIFLITANTDTIYQWAAVHPIAYTRNSNAIISFKWSNRRDYWSNYCYDNEKEKRINEINPGLVEDFREKRRKEPSPTKKGSLIAPSTINKEVSQLVTMLNKAVIHDKLEVNPLSGKINKLVEVNVRQKVLSHEDFENLILELTSPLREMFIVGFYLCMRQGEIIKLSWSSVDLDSGFIRLVGETRRTSILEIFPFIHLFWNVLKILKKNMGLIVFF